VTQATQHNSLSPSVAGRAAIVLAPQAQFFSAMLTHRTTGTVPSASREEIAPATQAYGLWMRDRLERYGN
jgi:hypothetical protein